MPLTLLLNGHSREFPDLALAPTLEDLVRELGLKGDRVAIELNGEIVSRTKWPEIALRDADKLEVVHFVGGGIC